MNQNIQRGNKPSSASQSNLNLPLGLYFPVPPLLPSQGVLSRQQRSSTSTHKPIILLSHSCQHQVSKQPTSVHGTEHGFPTAIPAPTRISGHKPQTGKTFCPLGICPPLPPIWRGNKFTTCSKRLWKFAWEVAR